ncbi:DMT family transporter [Roseisolibacter sp. H3M3-2]|uniref:DMT family transporter n=1 Tax=Roseisolibacter sp. H3M3-2 TaxID=3031323 RepID=UPI0023D9E924|nr:DMT family transporter [Roseisolibacter sp. H3M3-2]MDF1502772.1 DMT family transporter [Roseisolibacter sp. H3M3-2]
MSSRPGGLRHMALSAFWFSVMALCVKLGGRRLPSQELVLVRAVLTLGMSWAALRRAGLALRSDDPARQRALLARGAFGCLGLTCFYASLVRLPLAEATLLQYTNPIWASVLAAALLAERVGRREALCLAASVAGVVLVVRPAALLGAGGSAIPLGAVAVALLGSLGSAAAYVTIRKLGTAEPAPRVTLYLPLVTVPLTVPLAVAGWVWPTPREWAVLVAMSVATQLAQVQLTKGLQREPAARATAVGYLQLVFAAAWGWLVFAERPTAWTAAGALTIVAATLVLALRRSARPPVGAAPEEEPAAA